MTVYRDLDQTALDREYNAAGSVNDIGSIFKAWQQRSAAFQHLSRRALDIPYGTSAGETLDIFFAPANDAPIQIFFHGGYWRAQDKANFSYLAAPFVEAGATVVIPNYDLCPAVTIEEIVQQCRRSVAWVWRNARVFGSDPNAIAVYGHSAGGHIVAALGATDWSEFGAPEDVLKAATCLSGLFDLEPIRLSFLNADLRLDEEQVLRSSPRHQFLRRRIPFVICAGSAESNEFRRQSSDYAALLEGRNYATTLMFVDGCHHYTILDAACDLSHPLGRTLFDQLFGRGEKHE